MEREKLKELKPCPFCGGEAKLVKTKVKFSHFGKTGGTYYVYCKNCECKTDF